MNPLRALKSTSAQKGDIMLDDVDNGLQSGVYCDMGELNETPPLILTQSEL
jgi:hypothetical protein